MQSVLVVENRKKCGKHQNDYRTYRKNPEGMLLGGELEGGKIVFFQRPNLDFDDSLANLLIQRLYARHVAVAWEENRKTSRR